MFLYVLLYVAMNAIWTLCKRTRCCWLRFWHGVI